MAHSHRLSDSVHVLVLVALNPLGNLTSTRIAQSIATNASYVRQIMSDLRRAGILQSVHGHASPCLARKPSAISLWDVAQAIGQTHLLFPDTKTDPACGPGINIQLTLADIYSDIEQQAQAKMEETSLQDVIDGYQHRLAAHPELAYSD